MSPARPVAPSWPRAVTHRRESGFAFLLLLLLLVLLLVLRPTLRHPSAWGTEVGLAAPLVASAIAVMPAMLGGRGGIDVSIGPAMGFVNVVLVEILVVHGGIRTPWLVVPAALLLGGLIGLLNGALATLVRIQPIVATLGTYLILDGLTLTILPSPAGTAPSWMATLAGPLSAVPLAAMAGVWLALKQTPFYGTLLAVGSDDRACFTAGIEVTTVRLLSYVLSGVFAGVAGLVLTALIGSGDPTVGPGYTLIAISAAALGGVSLAGGRGGLLAATIGGVDVFLIQDVLTYFNASSFVLQIAFGLILVLSVSLNALTRATADRRAA